MSLLWAQANMFGKDSDVYYHPDPQSLTPSQTTDLPVRFEHDHHDGAWKAKLPDGHPGTKEHGYLAGYAKVDIKDLPEDHPDDPGGYTHHIKMIEVNPGYAGHHVGKALLEHVIRQAGYRGVSHGRFTHEGAHMWNSVTGENQRGGEQLIGDRKRNWRWAV